MTTTLAHACSLGRQIRHLKYQPQESAGSTHHSMVFATGGDGKETKTGRQLAARLTLDVRAFPTGDEGIATKPNLSWNYSGVFRKPSERAQVPRRHMLRHQQALGKGGGGSVARPQSHCGLASNSITFSSCGEEVFPRVPSRHQATQVASLSLASDSTDTKTYPLDRTRIRQQLCKACNAKKYRG